MAKRSTDINRPSCQEMYDETILENMTEKDPLEEIYQEIFEDALEYMKEHEVQAVAATYMAIAMRLYKTHLEDDAYKKMIETVMETEVKPYTPKKILH